MVVELRRYVAGDDYRRVDEFLLSHYQPGNRDGNWLEPAWEYMHSHPYLDAASLGRIGLWEVGGQLVAVAHYESELGEAFFEIDPGYRHLQERMLDYAESQLIPPPDADGRRPLRVYVNDDDEDLLKLVKDRGYRRRPRGDRPLTGLATPDPFPTVKLPPGFRLASLADECDWAKVHRVLWRGFDHPGEPPAGGHELEMRRRMFDTPTARRDLKVVVVSPSGDFAALCGMFVVPSLEFAYLEPLATDPDHRRMGLARAALLEGVRRCRALGARVCYVGSDQEFYRALGFARVRTAECWVKVF